jgi:phenylacetate-CoA ligase
VNKVLFAGVPLYPDQRERLNAVFPGVQCMSIGYSSTDAGLLGYADRGCGPGEHRSFTEHGVLEILDEATLRPIDDVEREGLLVVTALRRRLMPIVRYPVGDRGVWLEPKGTHNRKFRLLGRSEEGARIGLIKLYVQEVRQALEEFKTLFRIVDFQLIVYHQDELDGLVVRIATSADPASLAARSEDVVLAIHRARPLYAEFLRDRKVRPITVEWVAKDALETNPRTGKLRRVIDKRLEPRS